MPHWCVTRRDSSPSKKLKNCVPRSTSDPTLLSRSWLESNYNSPMSPRLQCPLMHYHPWCKRCWTLMEWEPPQPIRRMPKKSIMPFKDLKKVVMERSHYQSPFGWQIRVQEAHKKLCLDWREEQFARAIAKQSRQLVAQEPLCQQAHQQHKHQGVRTLK